MKVQIETIIDCLRVVSTANFIRCDPDYLPGCDYLEDVVVRAEGGPVLLTSGAWRLVEDLLMDEGRKRSKFK